MTTRGTWVVSQDSWHYKLYKTWLDYGGSNPSSYKENLCHYWRVVIFWALARWFVNREFKEKWWLRPVSIFGVTTIVVGSGILAYFFPLQMGIGVISLIAFVGLAIGLGFFSVWVTDDPERNRKWKRGVWIALCVLTFPIWIIPYLLVKLCETRPMIALGHRLKKIWNWFWDNDFWFDVPWGIYVIFTAIIASIIAATYIVGPIVLSWIGGIIVAIGFAMFVMWLVLGVLAPRVRNWILANKDQEKPKGTSTAKLAWGGVVAKKHKICPFVDILPKEGQ